MNDLIIVEPQNIQAVFTSSNGLDPYLEQIAKEARGLIPDTTTAKGRDEIRSMAAKIARSKTALDNLGKDLVSEMKELPKKVDAERKRMRDYLDALKDEVRKPLTDYEEEQERIKEAQAAEEAAKKLAEQVEHDWELAILMDREYNRQKEEAARLRAEELARRDEQIRKEAEERAARVLKEREDAARLAQIRAEEAQRDSEMRARLAVEQAEERAKQAAERAREEERKKQEEIERQRKAEEDRKVREEAARAADVEHRRGINRAILADLQAFCLLDEETGKAIITAVAGGLISNMIIKY